MTENSENVLTQKNSTPDVGGRVERREAVNM